MPVVGTGDVLECLEFPGRHLFLCESQSLRVLVYLIGGLEIELMLILFWEGRNRYGRG